MPLASRAGFRAALTNSGIGLASKVAEPSQPQQVRGIRR
jgi:hypothetical protein